MAIHTSCGHAIACGAGQGYSVALRIRAATDHPGVSYRLVCSQCRQRYREEGLVLEDHHAVAAWLSGRGDDAQPAV